MRPSLVKTTVSSLFSHTPTYGASTSGDCGWKFSSTEPGTSPPPGPGLLLSELFLEQEVKINKNALAVKDKDKVLKKCFINVCFRVKRLGLNECNKKELFRL